MTNPIGSESSSLIDSGTIDIVSSTPRFIESVKTTIITALRTTFDSNFPDPQFRDLYISMEYPILENHYPGLWVKFSFTNVQAAGIGSYFVDNSNSMFKRFIFEGRTTIQVFAMTSLERDKISDTLIYMFAFGDLNPNNSRFKKTISSSNYINMSINSDELIPGGQEENIGAPWQPDAIVYNDSYSFSIVGQFASDINTGSLITLDSININSYMSSNTPYNTTPIPNPFPPDDGNGVWQ